MTGSANRTPSARFPHSLPMREDESKLHSDKS
jgi:hypothetical protein